MLEVSYRVTNGRDKDGGYKRFGQTLVGRAKSDGAPLCAKCSSVCSRFELGGSVVVC